MMTREQFLNECRDSYMPSQCVEDDVDVIPKSNVEFLVNLLFDEMDSRAGGRHDGNIGLYKGVSKKTGKTIKGNLVQVGRKYYIVKFKSLTTYLRADYLWFNGGSEKHEVKKDSIEGIVCK